jgi:hypothetical protein
VNERPASRSTFTGHSFSEEWIDLRLVSIMRLMLASSTLMVAVISAPPSPPLHFEPGVVVLIFYTVYSAVVYFLSVRQSNLVPAIIMHWLDVGWYVVLIATNGTASIYFNFFFFAILVASFGWGYSTGLYLTLTSAALFTAVALWIAPGEQAVELNRILLRPIQLLILGYLISRWGGFRINLRNQLQLLKDVTGL